MRTALAALLALAPTAAHAAGASDIAAASKKVDGLLDAWRFGQADAALEALRKTAPNAPEVSYLDGYSKFMHGDYDGAAHALATAAHAPNATSSLIKIRRPSRCSQLSNCQPALLISLCRLSIRQRK